MKVEIDGRTFVGTATQIMQAMRSLAWQPARGKDLDDYAEALRANLEGLGVVVTFEKEATTEERCETILRSAIAAGLAAGSERDDG